MARKLLPAITIFCTLASPTLADTSNSPCADMAWLVCNSQDYSTGGLEGWNTERILNSYSAQIVDASSLPDVAGPTSPMNVIRFELRHGDHVSDGFRTEVKEQYNAENDATIRYAFTLLIPEYYPINEDHYDLKGHMYACIFGQWHDEPNPVTPNGREPVFENYYVNGDLRMYIKSLMLPSQYGSPSLFYTALSRANDPYDPGDLVGEIKNFEVGKWHTMLYQVKWSQDATGYLEAWVDHRLVVDYHGPVGYADEVGSYFKYGVYCKYDVTLPHVVYLGPYLRQLVARRGRMR